MLKGKVLLHKRFSCFKTLDLFFRFIKPGCLQSSTSNIWIKIIGITREFKLENFTNNAKVSIVSVWLSISEYVASLLNKSKSSVKIYDPESGPGSSPGSPTFVIVQNDRSDIETEQLL